MISRKTRFIAPPVAGSTPSSRATGARWRGCSTDRSLRCSSPRGRRGGRSFFTSSCPRCSCRVSRTQYQYTLEAADGALLDEWVPKLMQRLSSLPELTDIASDLQNQGLQAYVDIDRDSAGRLGITPAAIDTALYNAFGQRLIS